MWISNQPTFSPQLPLDNAFRLVDLALSLEPRNACQDGMRQRVGADRHATARHSLNLLPSHRDIDRVGGVQLGADIFRHAAHHCVPLLIRESLESLDERLERLLSTQPASIGSARLDLFG